MSRITVSKVLNHDDRVAAISVIEQVFQLEKQWITSAHEQLPQRSENNDDCSWFLARVDDRPAGVLRLQYGASLDVPEEYQVTFEPGVDPEVMKKQGRYVEIGRFMILKEFRKHPRIALRLMRIATQEVLEKDYTHFITDVFEGEEHSPLNFHTRVLGFEIIGRHMLGELHCSSTRIILTLDILHMYRRVRNSRSRIYRELTEGMSGLLDRKLSAMRL